MKEGSNEVKRGFMELQLGGIDDVAYLLQVIKQIYIFPFSIYFFPVVHKHLQRNCNSVVK